MNALLSLLEQRLKLGNNALMPYRYRNYFSNSELFFSLFQSPAEQFDMSLSIEKLIKKRLRELKISFMTDKEGNIYSLKNKNKPLLSAHMDTVQSTKDVVQEFSISYSTVDGFKFHGESCIGADDKVGCYILLEQLEKTPDINFIFSVAEESGCIGIKYLCAQEENQKRLKKIPYGLVLDRKNGKDIIGSDNYYCTKEFENKLVSLEHGFKPCRGSISDANELKKYFSCVNLSVGYYKPHSDDEYVILSEMEDTQDFVADIIENVTERFDPYIYTSPKTSYTSDIKRPKCYICGNELHYSSLDERPKIQLLQKVYDKPNQSYTVANICQSCVQGHLIGPINKLKDRKQRKSKI